MNYKIILLVIASIVVLITISFIMYKQSEKSVYIAEEEILNTSSQSITKDEEALLQAQIQQIISNGRILDCDYLTNDSYRLGCKQFFVTPPIISTSSAQDNLKVVETRILTEEEMREEMGEFFETLPKPAR